MIDRIFSAALTFCLLMAGTLAIGSALFGHDVRVQQSTRVIELPTVTVTGQRSALAVDTSASKVANAQPVGDCVQPSATVAPAQAVTGQIANI
jgi:hypothetical protein